MFFYKIIQLIMSVYKKTLNIPTTDFPMQANLSKLEPQVLEKWKKINLFDKLQSKDKPVYVMHPGPPYLNGDFHMGHGSNIILKDFILRSRNLLGFKVDINPAFDCHGLPTELKAQKNFKYDESKSGVDNIKEFRKICSQFNDKYLSNQLGLIYRSGLLLSSTNKYHLTRDYTAEIYEEFSNLLLNDFVEAAYKPVIWSINEKTTIADGEVEYYNKKSTSIFFMLKVQKSQNISFENVYLACWTTTPWTLVDNSAVAYNPNITYCFVSYQDKILIVAEAAVERLSQILDIKIIAKIKEDIFPDMQVKHPIRDINVPVLISSHVTDTDGTGFVHIAPAHGPEDYEVYLMNSIQMFESTNELGYYIKGSPLEGKHIFDDEEHILNAYRDITLHLEEIEHSYPFSQRTKTPIIYRATEQIFIKIHEKQYKSLVYNIKIHDDLCINLIKGNKPSAAHDIIHLIIERIALKLPENEAWNSAVKSFGFDFDFFKLKDKDFSSISSKVANAIINKKTLNEVLNMINDSKYSKLSSDLIQKVNAVKMIPSYLNDQLLEALNNRKEWCVSRQRLWGVPLALFVHKSTGQLLIDEHLQKLVIDKMKQDPEYFLSSECIEILNQIPNLNPKEYRPHIGILDVWFDSACIFKIVNNTIADVYCEGKDQIRGWFQSSLWVSYLSKNILPYKAIVSHGFVLDENRTKMSKTLGNVVDFKELLTNTGRDILSMWLAQSDISADIKIGDSVLNVAKETYRKFRNVLRYLTSVAEEFDGQLVVIDNLEQLYLAKYNDMEGKYLSLLENYQFKEAFEVIYLFILDISSAYFNARKDALYCDNILSTLHIRHFMYFLLHNLVILLTPFLPFTTDEIADYMKLPVASIHLYDKSNLLVSKSTLNIELADKIEEICIPIRQQIDILIREKQILSTHCILDIDFEYPDIISNAFNFICNRSISHTEYLKSPRIHNNWLIPIHKLMYTSIFFNKFCILIKMKCITQ